MKIAPTDFDACPSAMPSPGTTSTFLQSKKHVHNKSIAVLKNTAQNERYASAIQFFIEKASNSYDFPLRI
jgi:hypothetical protein